MTDVARRWQVSPQQVFDWRRQARKALAEARDEARTLERAATAAERAARKARQAAEAARGDVEEAEARLAEAREGGRA